MRSIFAKRQGLGGAALLVAGVSLISGCGSLVGTSNVQTGKHVASVAAKHSSSKHDSKKHRRHLHRHKKQSKTPVAQSARFSRQHRYAVKIVPVLDQSRKTFDRIDGSVVAVSSNLSALGNTCNTDAPEITLLSQQFDGVPHPWPWYWQLSGLHRHVMGVYHLMLGALQQCQTASSNGDWASVGTAVSDVSTATHQMRGVDDYAHSLAHRP